MKKTLSKIEYIVSALIYIFERSILVLLVENEYIHYIKGH